MVEDSHSTLRWFEFSPLHLSRRTRVLWLECKLGFYSFESDPSFAGSVMLYTEPIGYICMFWKSLVYKKESSVCNVTISAERVRGTVSHIGVLYLISEQFFPCEPDGGNCYASEHNLNQRIMREMLPKAII
ncbi:hypothetical protein PIB30_082468 [Stylosanthes scabra]|uniref:Uncharacterized protein n=1 Tax=Stylosanthes scabra TaxID=79078 RepID=A0ABU6SUA2_9FABA|nr:hypothetical protein [Stylosanthes scabra]